MSTWLLVTELSVLVSRSRKLRTFAPLPVCVCGCVVVSTTYAVDFATRAHGNARANVVAAEWLHCVYSMPMFVFVRDVLCHLLLEAEKPVVISLKEISVSFHRICSVPQRNPKVVSEATSVSAIPPQSPNPQEIISAHTLLLLLFLHSGQRCCDDATRLWPTWSRSSIGRRSVAVESLSCSWVARIGHTPREGDLFIASGCPTVFLFGYHWKSALRGLFYNNKKYIYTF